MVELRVVCICNQCAAFWDPDAEQAACTDPSHEHTRFDSHLHRSPVVFSDGTEVTAVSFGSAEGTYCERAVETDEQEAFVRNLTL